MLSGGFLKRAPERHSRHSALRTPGVESVILTGHLSASPPPSGCRMQKGGSPRVALEGAGSVSRRGGECELVLPQQGLRASGVQVWPQEPQQRPRRLSLLTP